MYVIFFEWRVCVVNLLCIVFSIDASFCTNVKSLDLQLLFFRKRKKHIKKTHIKNFRGSQGGGVRGPNSVCWCHFPLQNTVHKEC